MNVKTETHRIIDIPLAGSTLRLVLVPGDGGDPGALTLAHGFGGSGEPFRRPEWCGPPVQVPADALPRIRQALAALAEEEAP